MNTKLLSEHLLELLCLTGGCTVSSEFTLVKLPHCCFFRLIELTFVLLLQIN